jgi:hypothetical protein
MEDRFILVWTVDGESANMPHSTQNEALQRAEGLMREHGYDLDIALHLNRIERPSVLFSKKRMRDWCLAGFPAVQI